MSLFTLESSDGKLPTWLPQQRVGWVYFLIHFLCRLYLWPACRIRIEGAEHLPLHGGGVIVCNHTRGHDYVPLGMGAPRQIFFMAKAEAFGYSPILRYILEQGGVFPVDRRKGDLHALEVAVQIVQSGKLLGMFPEGHRSPDGTLQRGKTGATRIALQSGAPVIPAAVIGAHAAFTNFPRFWRRTLLVVRYGEPYLLAGTPTDRAAIAAGTRRIMNSIAALLPPELRGEWSGDLNEAAPPRRSPRAAAEALPTGEATRDSVASDDAAAHAAPAPDPAPRDDAPQS